jgi:AcrR family transcriptional regulator
MMAEAMSSPGPSRERVAQKLRTRQALLTAARELVADGAAPTVAQAADAAMVSRATAYRYFPSQEALLVELPLDVAAPTVDQLFGHEAAPRDAEDRAALVQNALYDLARDHEAEFRLFLRSSLLRSLDADGSADPFRGARRSVLLDAALAPLAGELAPGELEQLATALSMLVGIEPLIVLRDVMGLDHERARAAGERTVRELVRAARAHSAAV